ncbi:MAG: hypothetical protein ACKV2Q_11505 [Planctomycetaceae bacterium]
MPASFVDELSRPPEPKGKATSRARIPYGSFRVVLIRLAQINFLLFLFTRFENHESKPLNNAHWFVGIPAAWLRKSPHLPRAYGTGCRQSTTRGGELRSTRCDASNTFF